MLDHGIVRWPASKNRFYYSSTRTCYDNRSHQDQQANSCSVIWRERANLGNEKTMKRSPPMVLSWYSWNWPLTKRSTKLDFPTADSPSSTSLNWQILLLAAVPLVRAGPPRPAMVQCWSWGRRSRVKVGEFWTNFRPGLGKAQIECAGSV